MVSICVFGAFALLLQVVCAQDYCNVCKNHTMCDYKGVNSSCGAGTSGVSSAEQEQIVDYHNQLRTRIAKGQETRGKPGPQYPASNMKKIVWDDELSKIAQRWADQCTFKHDICKDTLSGTYVGQNLAKTSSSNTASVDWTYAINMWYDEVKDYDRDHVGRFTDNDMGAGHYTQVVWAETSRIGCGRRQYQSDKWNNQFYVCNYATGGNYKDQPVYKTGNACSACSGGCSDGLCV